MAELELTLGVESMNAKRMTVEFEPEEFNVHLTLKEGKVETIGEGRPEIKLGENFILKVGDRIISWKTAEGKEIWLEEGSPEYDGQGPIKLELLRGLVRNSKSNSI